MDHDLTRALKQLKGEDGITELPQWYEKLISKFLMNGSTHKVEEYLY